RALDYLERSELPDGRLARFYELKTNRPLYFTRDYKLTYNDTDVPTHYSFKVGSDVDKLRQSYETLAATPREELNPSLGHRDVTKTGAKLKRKVRQIIDAMDERGAWVTDTGLRYHNKPGNVIDMRETVRNLNTLADFLMAE
ncbi:MAG: pectate lyase, partial [Rhodospirillales bacterium]|nr:pectate lyase [Rhodospirillales bacterium]